MENTVRVIKAVKGRRVIPEEILGLATKVRRGGVSAPIYDSHDGQIFLSKSTLKTNYDMGTFANARGKTF